MAFTQYVTSKPRTQPLGTARGVRIFGGEDGFELYFDTDDGCFVVNVHAVSEELLAEVEREIGGYWQEARSEMSRAKILTRKIEPEAYDEDDPKHPGWSIRADWEPSS